MPPLPDLFLFERYAFDPASGALELAYRYDGGGPAFTERLRFPPLTRPLSDPERAALETALRLLFLLAGVSYAKAFMPRTLACPAFPLDPVTAAFVEDVYRQGLAECAYRNGVDLDGRLVFQADALAAPPVGTPLPHLSRALVPVGGGKDSTVTLEALRGAGEDITLFALGGPNGPAAPIRATCEVAGLPLLSVQRVLSPNLAEVNHQEGAINGHIPITAIVSGAALITALVQGFANVVLSNERSASAPNVIQGGHAVNHQFSKSFAFESALNAYVTRHISPNLLYFSLLRPLSEAAIAKRFAALSRYHDVFRSCNTAFRQNESKRASSWCGACPKCRFVFLALAPFMDKDRLIRIFGANLLDDPAQTAGFAALGGLDTHKPFECVGEEDESRLLLAHLARHPAWRDSSVVHALAPRLTFGGEEAFAERFQALFTPSWSESLVPERYRSLF